MVAEGLAWRAGDRVITTVLEESPNFVPWLHLREKGVECDVLPVTAAGTIDPARIGEAITDRTRLVAVSQVSGVLGSVIPIREIGRICREHGTLLLVDGTHSVPRMPVDVSSLGCDFICFAGDRMLGPTGIGVLWMKNPGPEPLYAGGGMVGTASRDGFTLAEGYQRYEAGTPNVAGGIGLGAAADYLAGIGMERILDHEACLTGRMIEGLRGLPGVKVHGPGPSDNRTGIVSFTVEGLDPRDVAVRLDEASDILVGTGHHDCQPLMEQLGLPGGTVRAGISPFTVEEEVDLLVATVAELVKG